MILLPLLLNKAVVSPIPQLYTVDDEALIYVGKPTYSCKVLQKDCSPLIQSQKELFEKTMFPKGAPAPKSGAPKIDLIAISLQTEATPKSVFEANESYTLKTNKSGVFIDCFDIHALSRAFATLTQLIQEAPGDEYQQGLYTIQQITVIDHPIHPFRSLMVDSSRHYLEKKSLFKQVQALALAKMNVLHIHVIDSQSNSFVPERKPANEFEKTTYSSHGVKFRYTGADLAGLAEYANQLGVFILVEFDMPGHAGYTWRNVNEQISANCPQQGYSSVNPVNQVTYEYIKAYIQDIFASLYGKTGQKPMIHLGGDEVDHNCWNADPAIVKYMKDNGLNTQSLWKQFHKKVADIVNEINPEATRFYWQESFDNGNDMSGNVVVHTWMNINKKVVEVTNKNLRALRSDQWYLDVQQPGAVRHSFIESWMDMYAVKPYDGVADDKKHLVMGGATCLWSEKVSSANLDGMIWPRALAVAEILWSEPENRDITQDLKSRLNKQVCHLAQIGVATHTLTAAEPCMGFQK